MEQTADIEVQYYHKEVSFRCFLANVENLSEQLFYKKILPDKYLISRFLLILNNLIW